MKILVISQYFYPESFRVNDLAEAFVKRGHQVTVLAGTPNYPAGRFYHGYGWFSRTREYRNGVDIIRVPLIPRGRGGKLRLFLNYVSFAATGSVLGPFRCRGSFDTIFVHEVSPVTVGIPAIVMKILKRAPVLFWVLDLWPESIAAASDLKSPAVMYCAEKLVRFIYRHSDKVLVQSRGFIPRVTSQGVPESRIHYFPNWAEPWYGGDPTPSSELPTLPDGFVLMFAGNIGHAQDFGTVLGAAERLKHIPDLHWVIIGDGRKASWVREEVERRGLAATIHMLGQQPPKAMPDFFARADAMLVTLASNPIFAVTVPAKVQAYLASGKPIVAALDGEGARIVNESGAGFVATSSDTASLAEAVQKMYSLSKPERESMGATALRYSREHFDREQLFDQLEHWMRDATKKKKLALRSRGVEGFN